MSANRLMAGGGEGDVLFLVVPAGLFVVIRANVRVHPHDARATAAFYL